MGIFKKIFGFLTDISASVESMGRVRGNQRLGLVFLMPLDTIGICAIISCFTGIMTFMYVLTGIAFIAGIVINLTIESYKLRTVEELLGWGTVLLYAVFIFTLVICKG